MEQFPGIWGNGGLFAFSGLDGPTSITEPFVLATQTDLPGLGVRWLARTLTFEKRSRLGGVRLAACDCADLDLHLPDGGKTRLRLVFLNLLINARDALRAVDVRRLTVAGERREDRVEIRVIDTGAGVAEGTIEQIFDAFVTTKPAGTGTGLGLTLSLNTVRAFGGSLRCESLPGRGATFTVTLPIAGGETSAEPENQGPQTPDAQV